MAGCVGSLISNGALGKKSMKVILNVNQLSEIILMVAYNAMRLVLVPSKLVVREGKLYRMNASPTGLILDHLAALWKQYELTKVSFSFETLVHIGRTLSYPTSYSCCTCSFICSRKLLGMQRCWNRHLLSQYECNNRQSPLLSRLVISFITVSFDLCWSWKIE